MVINMKAVCPMTGSSHCAPPDGIFGSPNSVTKCVVGNCGRGRVLVTKTPFFQWPTRDLLGHRGLQSGLGFRISRPQSKRGILFMASRSGDEDLSLPPDLDEVLEYIGSQDQGQTVLTTEIPRDSEVGETSTGESSVQEGYLGVFVRMLGLDNSEEDREDAVRALWRHSMGGKEFIDEIVYFPGCLNLIVSLLPSERPESCEAAVRLLRNISAVNEYRSAVAEAGALEEIAGLLTRRSIFSDVKEQATYVLCNLSVEEEQRRKLIQPDILHMLFTMLGSNVVGEREAAAGVISNLAECPENHEVLVQGGIIPRFARILLSDAKESNVSRQEVRNSLLRLATDSHLKLLIIEEGLIPVPSIGASAYRSFKPLLQVAPELPDGVKVKQPATKVASKFGAGELLLGLNSDTAEIDDETRLIMEGRVRQQFLGRIGLLGKSAPKSDQVDQVDNEKITLLPWWDGIPRLVLILGLDQPEVARQAALAIAEIAISEDNRQAVHKAGAIPHLVRLLGSGDEDATAAAALALEKLAVSRQIRRSINAHDAPSALVAILKAESAPETVKAKVVGALFRLSQTQEAEATPPAGAIPGLLDIVRSDDASSEAKEEAEEVLEELSALNADPRDKIIAAGGLIPLIQIMRTGSPDLAERAICVLENLALEELNAEAIFDADVRSALLLLLEVDLQEEVVQMSSGKTLSKEDCYMLIRAALRLLEKLAGYEKVKTSNFGPLLSTIFQSDVPANIKDCVAACLLKLEQQENSSL